MHKMQYVNDATLKYGERAKQLAPSEVQPYYFKVISENNTYFSNQVNQSKKRGCYVATCVYGSYNCPQVWTLRRYRDNALASTWYGRVFIKTYYSISPYIVKWFGNSRLFNKFWRSILNKIVSALQNAGFDNTPYNDKT